MSSLANFPVRRRRLPALLALAAAALATTALTASASAAPSVTLTHDPDLVTNPTVAVAGTGFTSPTPVLEPGQGKIGLYAAQTAVVDGEIVVGEAQQWIRPVTFGGAGISLLNGDGTFSSELDVDQVIGTAPDQVDCAVVQCYITTWQAHGNPVLDQLFTQSPIYFAPTIVAEPAKGIAATGQTIAVDGGGVESAYIAGNGINLSQIAIVGGEVKTPKPSGPARWIRSSGTGPNQLTANGTFESELSLSSTFTTGTDEIVNCGLVQCAIAFWPGHTNPTPGTLIASQNISFAYAPSATVTPTANLPETQQVTITGSGFSPGEPGVYVSQVAQVGDAIVFPPPGGGATMQWVRPGGPTPDQTLDPDGSFETAVTVSRTFEDSKGATVDCSVVQCSVITWRAHSNPTSATLYTSAPLTFSSTVPTPPTPGPSPGAPPSAKLTRQSQFKLGTKAKRLDFVTVRCGSASCQFQKPKRVAVTIGKQKLWLAVTGPKRAGADKVARFGVRVSTNAAKRLEGRKARVKFQIKARSDSGTRTITVNKLLVGASG